MTYAQGLLRLLWGGPKLECYGTESTILKYAAKGVSIDSKPMLTFIEKVCCHLEDRFSEDQIQDWIALDATKL